MIEAWSDSVLWIVIVSFIIAFVLAFAMGANDVANSFGTSVGSKVLTPRQACMVASVMEIAGAVLVGYKVSDTIRKGILNSSDFDGSEKEMMLGMMCALVGCALWLLMATMLRLPVSGTHSIVGSTLGFALVARGAGGVDWWNIGKIIISWFVSPLMSGIISSIFFYCIRRFILSKEKPLEPGLRSLPFIYALTIGVNVFSVLHDGSELLYFDRIPLWGVFVATFGAAALAGILVQLFVVPWQRKKILADMARFEASKAGSLETVAASSSTIDLVTPSPETRRDEKSQYQSNIVTVYNNTVPLEKDEKTEKGSISVPEVSVTGDDAAVKNADPEQPPATPELMEGEKPETLQLFSVVQVLTASCGSFAHGGNDVSNAIGPVIAIWIIYSSGSMQDSTQSPLWILFYGGLGISVGLWILGMRVMKTVGEDLTTITPSSGFTTEFGAALTVLIASKIGIPISTTHCIVGSVVCVGWVKSRQGVDWKLFRNIAFAWLVTLPVSGGISAALMAIFRATVL